MMKLKCLLVASIFLLGPGANASENRIIVVTAFSESAIEPDLVNLGVEIWSKAQAAGQTQNLAATESKRVMALLDKYQINKKDIRTEALNFGPEYVWDQVRNQNKLDGYRYSQILKVTLRNKEQVGKFIDALIVPAKASTTKTAAQFGTNISSLQWDTSKREELDCFIPL